MGTIPDKRLTSGLGDHYDLHRIHDTGWVRIDRTGNANGTTGLTRCMAVSPDVQQVVGLWLLEAAGTSVETILGEVVAERDEAQRLLADATRRAGEAEAEARRLLADRDDWQAQAGVAREERDNALNGEAELRVQVGTLRTAVQALQEDRDRALRRLDDLRAEYDDDHNALSGEAAEARAQVRAMGEALEGADARHEERERELEAEVEAMERERDEVRQELVTTGLEGAMWESLALEKDATLEAVRAHLDDTRRHLQALTAPKLLSYPVDPEVGEDVPDATVDVGAVWRDSYERSAYAGPHRFPPVTVSREDLEPTPPSLLADALDRALRSIGVCGHRNGGLVCQVRKGTQHPWGYLTPGTAVHTTDPMRPDTAAQWPLLGTDKPADAPDPDDLTQAVVVDNDGDVWRPSPDGQWVMWGGALTYAWDELRDRFGPIRPASMSGAPITEAPH